MSHAAKVKAAEHVLRYGYSRRLVDLDRALLLLEESVDAYRRLALLTDYLYRDASSLHTGSRRIPFVAAPDTYLHWRQCLPAYEKELECFRQSLFRLKSQQRERKTEATTRPSASTKTAEVLTEERLTELDQLFESTPTTQGAR